MQNVCFFCSEPFNSSLRCPRFLPDCGHSLCSLCLQTLLSNTPNLPSCPQCFTPFPNKTLLSDFLPNLQLLTNNMKYERGITPHKHKKSMDLNMTQGKCLKHERPFEAFCRLEGKAICLTCLLENQHRFHEVVSLKEACAEQKQKLVDFYEELENIESKIYEELKEGVEKKRECLKLEFERVIDKIREIFIRLHNVLNEKQGEFEDVLKKEYQKKEKELSLRELTMNKSIDFLSEFKREYNEIKRGKDIEILAWSLEKEPIFIEIKNDRNRGNMKPKEMTFMGVFKKNCKFDGILKEISEVFKGEDCGIKGGKGFLEKVKVKGKENWGGYLKTRENVTMNTSNGSNMKEASFLIEEQRKFHLKMSTFT